MEQLINRPKDRVEMFQSLPALRAKHNDLLKRRAQEGNAQKYLDEVENFILCSAATGVVLDAYSDRRAVQSLLQYWAELLLHAERTPPDPMLKDFDPKQAPELAPELCPYRGLETFRPEDHHLFFGRQRLIKHMIKRLAQNDHLLVLVGPSGCGKSSLALAGLVPALQTGALPGSRDWRYYPSMVPGSQPLVNLAQLIRPPAVDTEAWIQEQVQHFQHNPNYLAQLLDEQGKAPALLVIDQFEELFTLCSDRRIRQAFIENLVSLIQAPDAKHTVILTMRTDFENNIQFLPKFQPLFEKARLQVTPLTTDELRDAIEKPAEPIGLKFEDGLVDNLLHDILGDPMALPLLQFTLLKLWEERQRNRITMETYRRLGGGRSALARSADAFYDKLLEEERRALKRILLKMVQPSKGLEVTSNRIRLAEIFEIGEARYRIEHVVGRLIDERLVKISGADVDKVRKFLEDKSYLEQHPDIQIEVAHEALIRNWPRLVGWLDEERVNMRQHLNLRAAAREWERFGKDESALWSGLQLEEALRFEDLDRLEREFVEASIALRNRQAEEKEAQRAAQQELHDAQVKLKFQNRLRAAMVVVILLAVAAAVLGYQAQKQADIAENKEKQAKLNLSKLWAAEAQNLVTEQPQGSLLLAAEAVTLSAQLQGEPLPQTVRALNSILTRTGGEPLQTNDSRIITDATVLTLSPDQHWLAAGSRNGAVYLWNLTTDKPLTAITMLHPHKEAITSMAFSIDGHWLATGSKDNTVQLIDMLATNFTATVKLTEHRDDVTTLAFRPTNRLTNGSTWLAVGSADKTVQFFDLTDQDPITVSTFFQEDAGIHKIIFSPDGRWLATVTTSDTLRLRDVATMAANRHGLDSWVLSREKDGLIAFSPKGTWLVAASNTSPNVQLYAMAEPDTHSLTPNIQFLGGQLLGHGQGVHALAFDTDEQWFAVGNNNGSVRLWNLHTVLPRPPMLPKQPLVGSLTDNSSLEVLPYPVLTKTVSLLFSNHISAVSALAFDSAGEWLATGGIDHSFQLWHIADLVAESQPTFAPTSKLYGSDGTIEIILWGDQKEQVFIYSDDGSIRLWKPFAPPPVLQDLTTEEWVALACTRAGRDFSEEEKVQHFGDAQYVSACAQINAQPR